MRTTGQPRARRFAAADAPQTTVTRSCVRAAARREYARETPHRSGMSVDDSVPRITTSRSIRDSFPPECASAIRNAIQLCSHAFRLNLPYLQSRYPGIIRGDSPLSPRHSFAAKPGQRLYLHENNHQTSSALFSFLYNGFRVSLFTQNVPLAATLW